MGGGGKLQRARERNDHLNEEKTLAKISPFLWRPILEDCGGGRGGIRILRIENIILKRNCVVEGAG